jgi:hypothetical protein
MNNIVLGHRWWCRTAAGKPGRTVKTWRGDLFARIHRRPAGPHHARQEPPAAANRRPRAKLQSLLEQRDPLYREVADIVVDTSQQNVNLLVSRLLDQLHNIPAKT